MVFCSSCGNEELDEKSFCSKCGSVLRPSSKISERKKPTEERSRAWYLAPILIGVIGGIIAYFILRHDDPKLARNCLILGFILWIVFAIIYASIFGASTFMILSLTS